MKIGRPASQGSSVHENSSTQMESKVKGSDLRLPCPVRYGDPEFYANVTEHCKAGKTFKGMRGVMYGTLPPSISEYVSNDDLPVVNISKTSIFPKGGATSAT